MRIGDLHPGITLAELVTAWPRLAARLDRLGLDYCCGGHRRLNQAVAEVEGLELDQVLAELRQAVEAGPAVSGADDWARLSPLELVDQIEAVHHAYLVESLPQLAALASKVAGVHGARHPELARVEALVGELRADLEPHLVKEERVLFPLIRRLLNPDVPAPEACGTLGGPVAVMTVEHERVGELLRALHSATGGFQVPDDGCASYQLLYRGLAELEADTHLHVHKENNVVFPAAVEAERQLAAAQRQDQGSDEGGDSACWAHLFEDY